MTKKELKTLSFFLGRCKRIDISYGDFQAEPIQDFEMCGVLKTLVKLAIREHSQRMKGG